MNRFWKEGTMGIPVKGGKTKIAHYWATVKDRRSKYGIDKGRITMLEIMFDGKKVLSYNRGWVIEPDENDEALMIAYSICLQQYN